MTNYKALILEAFQVVVENPQFDEKQVNKYFHEDYQHHVDGVKLDYNGFCRHMKLQKEAVKRLDVNFKTMVCEGNIIFTNHFVNFETKEGREVCIHVIAEFHFQGQRIIYCNELTRMISGDNQDRDLGSRH